VNKSLYLKAEPDDVGDYVLLTGDPARVDRIAAKLDTPRTVAQNREFYSVTGNYEGRAMSAVSAGIGAPSAAIAIEELKMLGVKAVVRVGTMMVSAGADSVITGVSYRALWGSSNGRRHSVGR